MLVSRRAVLALTGAFQLSYPPVRASPRPPGPDDRSVSLLVEGSILQAWPQGDRERVIVTENHTPEAKAIAATVPEGRAIPVIYLVVGVLSIPVIWDTIAELWKREYYGGVIIDLRTAQPKITTDKAVPARMVFVIAASGAVTKYDAQNFSERILEKILPGLKS